MMHRLIRLSHGFEGSQAVVNLVVLHLRLMASQARIGCLIHFRLNQAILTLIIGGPSLERRQACTYDSTKSQVFHRLYKF